MNEKNFQTFFTKWIKDHPQETSVFELKICKLKSIPFDAVKKHQAEALHTAKYGFLYHKINDMPIFAGSKTRFTNPKPFDCFSISAANAYVVIWFYKPRKKKEMIWIDIDEWLYEASTSDRKSLTEERAKEIGKTLDF